jgi:hypothetical protein
MKSLLLSLFISILIAASSFAATIKEVQFRDKMTIDQYELRLHGVALLKWAMLFDVYVGALYLPEGTPGRFWPEDLPKRLELSYFREIKGAGFAEASISLLKENMPAKEYQKIEQRLIKFCALFQDVKPGDRYSITYTPPTGTELRLNNRILGAVPGADFAAAYFGIWLGQEPISVAFRDRLLADN